MAKKNAREKESSRLYPTKLFFLSICREFPLQLSSLSAQNKNQEKNHLSSPSGRETPTFAFFQFLLPKKNPLVTFGLVDFIANLRKPHVASSRLAAWHCRALRVSWSSSWLVPGAWRIGGADGRCDSHASGNVGVWLSMQVG